MSCHKIINPRFNYKCMGTENNLNGYSNVIKIKINRFVLLIYIHINFDYKNINFIYIACGIVYYII